MTKITRPMSEETIAGFHPMVVLDWVPQEDPLIEGHAVYLGLREVSAMKLLCWVPTSYPGHLDLPIMHKNHTHTMHDLLVEDYWNHHAVHQEQELIIAARTACVANGKRTGYLESPAIVHRLGDWLVMEEAVKCLTAFDARFASYVAHPVVTSWTQEQALAIYD